MDRGIKRIVLENFDVYGNVTFAGYDVGYKWEDDKPYIYCIYTDEDIYDILMSAEDAKSLLNSIEDQIVLEEKEAEEQLEKDDLPYRLGDDEYDRQRDEISADMAYETVRESKWRE